MFFKRLLGALMAVSILTVSFVGCSQTKKSSTAEAIKLTLWGSADDQAMLGEMVNNFKNQNSSKTYEIELKVMGEDVAKTEVLKDLDAAADVFAIAHDQLGDLVQSDAVYENTKYASDVKNNVSEGAVAASTYKEKLYGYPASQKTYFLHYDKRIFNENDVKSLNSMLSKTVPNGTSKIGMDIANAYYSAAFFLTNGCELFGPNGTDSNSVTFNNAQGLQAANYISTLKNKGVISINDETSDTQFTAGKLGAYITGDWKTKDFEKILGNNYGVAELPLIDMGSGEKHMKSFSGYNIYCVNAKSKQALEAMNLANFLTNKDNQKKRFEMRSLLPVNKELMNGSELKRGSVVTAIFAQLNYSVTMPSISQISKFWEPTKAFTKDAFDGNISSANMQSKLDQLVKDITS